MNHSKPMMTIHESVKQCLRKYADFSGRATRAEFWYWLLATTIVLIVFYAIGGAADALPVTLLGVIFQLVTLPPSLSVTARRLHDIGRSGWWGLLYWFVIGVSFVIWYLVFVLITYEASPGLEGFDSLFVALALIILVPTAVVMTVVCVPLIKSWSRRGQTGLNRFGPDPRVMDSP